MGAADEGVTGRTGGRTNVERTSDLELVVTRTVNAPARLVFEAWTTPELFMRWWAPKSMGMSLTACELDVRTGGRYRLEFAHPSAPEPIAFFGRYIEVIPNTRIVWTNEESGDGAVTTVTFEEDGGKTVLTLHDRYPSKEAADEAVRSGSTGGYGEQFDQLEELLAGRAASA
jgi:uncharacterized protein YndB with AHSA1/START domain